MGSTTRARLIAWVVAAGMAGGTAVRAQEPVMPKPGPAHEVLKMDAGVWDAVIEVTPPGAPAMTSKGVETSTMGCGGLCLITDFKGEMMPGMSFLGHGVATYDPAKKKYTMAWTDSMSAGLSIGESTWDATAKRMTGTMEGPDMGGQVTKMRTVTETKGNTRVFTIYPASGPAGATDTLMMKITYTRRN